MGVLQVYADLNFNNSKLLGLPAADRVTPLAQRFRAWNDFISATASPDWAFVNNGTGNSWGVLSPPPAGALGVLRGNLGTTATGRVSLGQMGNLLRLGQGEAVYRQRFALPSLSDATNTYTFRAGFLDSNSGESADGVFFRYTHAVNGGRFQAVTRSNNVETGTAADTGVAPVAGQYYTFTVVVNAAGTAAEFWIDGTLAATLAANIPAAAGRETGYGCMVIRSVGTASFNAIHADYAEVDLAFASVRPGLRAADLVAGTGDPWLDVAPLAGNHTVNIADNLRVLEFATAATVTLTAGIPEGWRCEIIRTGTGAVTLAAGVGVTLRGAGTTVATQWKGCTVYSRGGNEFVAIGDLI